MADKVQKRQLTATIHQLGLGRAADFVIAHARECAYMTPSYGLSPLRLGLPSKIGGSPNLPRGVSWPSGQRSGDQPPDRPAFVAQINLAHVPELDGMPLPRKGGVWLFMHASDDGMALEAILHPKPPSGVHLPFPANMLIHVARLVRAGRLARHRMPGAAVAVAFRRGLSLPFSSRDFREGVGTHVGTDPAKVNWYDLIASLTPDLCLGKIGGYPHDHELDPLRHVAIRRLGHPECVPAAHWYTISEYEDRVRTMGERTEHMKMKGAREWQRAGERVVARLQSQRPIAEWVDANRSAIASEAARWQLLISFTDIAMDLGDSETLDVFARSEDLASGHFSDLAAEDGMAR